MKNSSVEYSKNLITQLERIETLFEAKNYADAVAEIRDFENTYQLDQIPSDQLYKFYYFKASVLRFVGNYQDALETANQAFSLVKDINDAKRIAEIQYVLGSIHMSLGDLKNGEIEIRDAQAGFRKVYDFKGIIATLNQLAYIESIRGNFFKSVELLHDALGYCDQVHDERYKTILHGELGRRFTLMGKWDKAEENLSMNVELNKKAEDEISLCRGLLSLGYVYFLKKRYKESSEAYEKSLVLILKNNCIRELAIYHEYRGELWYVQGEIQNAQDHYMEAIGVGEKIAPDSGIISQTYRLLAELQITQKHYDESLSTCRKALKVAESLGEKVEIGAIHRALGQIYTVKQEKEKAREHFQRAISILEEIKAKFELGKAYLEAGKSDTFEYYVRWKYLGRAEDLFKELGSSYYQGVVNSAIGHLLFVHNDPERALLFLDSAEKIFRELSEEKELNQTLALKKRIAFIPPSYSSSLQVAFKDIITQDPEMLSLLDKAQQTKDTGFTILLEGETGTGKDLLARAIHCESRFKDKPFVIVNCAAIPKDLVESELFGYRKGAFTGAIADKKGLVEEAEGGTLFLNEIADLPLLTQAKLLGAIEDKQLTRVGDTKPRKVEFRVIAASNRDLQKQVKAGNFREDLYFRLSVIKLMLPPLRERIGDIPLLVGHFLKKHFGDDGNELSGIQPRILKIFESYPWPGNVRELQNEIIKLITLNGGECGDGSAKLPDKFFSSEMNLSENGSALCGLVAEYEKKLILKTLEENNWVKERTAKALKIPVTTLKNKIKLHRIDRPNLDADRPFLDD
jgi:DNA-binding NtrC family response regulator